MSIYRKSGHKKTCQKAEIVVKIYWIIPRYRCIYIYVLIVKWTGIYIALNRVLLLLHNIGIKVQEHGPLLKDMFQTDYFRIVVCDDETTVEVCGALKVYNVLE